MGSSCTTGRSVDPTTDIFVDKIIKYLMAPITGLLSLTCLIVLYLVDKVDCYSSASLTPGINEYCWNNFTSLTKDSSGAYVIKSFLPHKIFPIITLCEAISMLLPLFLWSWCFGKNFETQITAVIDQSNNLTEYFRMYDKGVRRTVAEATLHRELDHYLELLISIFMYKMPRIYVMYVLKWVFVLIFCFGWIAGQVYIHFPDMSIFVDTFLCVSGSSTGTCSIPTTTFLRAVWYINIAFIGLILICSIAALIIIGKGTRFESTFFYSHVPGAMDTRVADCIDDTFSKQHFALLGRFCEDNSHLCNDPGLSRSLSRKYGVLDGITPGRETIMERHFPVLQPEQIRKFRLACEQFKTKKQHRGRGKQKVRFARKRSDSDSIYSTAESIVNSMRARPPKRTTKNKVHNTDRDFYLTPRLMQRKMAQDLKSIKSSSKFSSVNTSKRTPRNLNSKFSSVNTSQRTPRSLSSINLTTPRSSTPMSSRRNIQLAKNKKENPEPQHPGHYPLYAGREYNAFAYRLHNLIMQANAKNNHTWKP